MPVIIENRPYAAFRIDTNRKMIKQYPVINQHGYVSFVKGPSARFRFVLEPRVIEDTQILTVSEEQRSYALTFHQVGEMSEAVSIFVALDLPNDSRHGAFILNSSGKAYFGQSWIIAFAPQDERVSSDLIAESITFCSAQEAEDLLNL